MLTFLFFSALAIAAALIGLAALPLLAIGAAVWLVLLPIKLLIRLAFGIGGALLGLLIAPLVMVVVGVALLVAFVTAVVALFVPLIPVVLLALLGWAIIRASSRRRHVTGLS